MKNIRRQVSEIVGVMIPEKGWDKTFSDLEIAGKLGQRQIIDILLVILKRLEENENK